MRQKKPIEQVLTYRPAIAIQRIPAHEKLYTKLLVAPIDAPTEVCGTAKRIGVTGSRASDLVLYRIKLWTEQKRLNYMLPSLFVVEDGIFLDINDWQAQQQNFSTLFNSLSEQLEQLETSASSSAMQEAQRAVEGDKST
jgi:hypothetical protein